jgi:hypothetical protein
MTVENAKRHYKEVDINILKANLTRKYAFKTERDYGSFIVLDEGRCVVDGIQYGCRAEISTGGLYTEYKVYKMRGY